MDLLKNFSRAVKSAKNRERFLNNSFQLLVLTRHLQRIEENRLLLKYYMLYSMSSSDDFICLLCIENFVFHFFFLIRFQMVNVKLASIILSLASLILIMIQVYYLFHVKFDNVKDSVFRDHINRLENSILAFFVCLCISTLFSNSSNVIMVGAISTMILLGFIISGTVVDMMKVPNIDIVKQLGENNFKQLTFLRKLAIAYLVLATLSVFLVISEKTGLFTTLKELYSSFGKFNFKKMTFL